MLKLLDYGQANPFGQTIGRSRRLAWPVNAFRVTLPRPSRSDGDVNPFERVVLKLLDAFGTMSDRELAQDTGIPLDLVRSILLRLRDKGLIDGDHAVIEKEHDPDHSASTPVFVTALVFRELVTGKCLPFVHWLDDAHPLQNKEAGEGLFREIRWEEQHKQAPLTQRDVIAVLRAAQRRSRAFGKDERTPALQQVSIVHRAELYHLDCPIAIQKSDGEFRIADPFGDGFSLVLERALEQRLEQDDSLAEWLRQWKSALRNPRPQVASTRSKEPYETDANWQRYRNLLTNLCLARSASFHSLAQMHASIEWTLFYAVCRRPFESAIGTLKYTAQSEHPALLADAAKQLGLSVSPFGLRPIRDGKLIDFENEKAELGTVLSIALLQAQADRAHPLHNIASAHPDFIVRLFDIKQRRDQTGHGKGKADAPEYELSDAPFMRETIHALLPDIVFSGMPSAALDANARADALLDARASIQSEFGFKTCNRLGVNLKERLIHAERFFLSCKDGDDGLVFVRELYAALQATFEMALAGKLPPDVEDAQLIALAGERAVTAKLGSRLPDAVRTVKASAVRQTLQGRGQSLGACVLAFLLMSDDERLQTVVATQPTFVSDVSDIVTRRGHGNEPLPLLRADAAALRKAAYKTIKTLIEV